MVDQLQSPAAKRCSISWRPASAVKAEIEFTDAWPHFAPGTRQVVMSRAARPLTNTHCRPASQLPLVVPGCRSRGLLAVLRAGPFGDAADSPVVFGSARRPRQRMWSPDRCVLELVVGPAAAAIERGLAAAGPESAQSQPAPIRSCRPACSRARRTSK